MTHIWDLYLDSWNARWDFFFAAWWIYAIVLIIYTIIRHYVYKEKK